MIRLRTVLPVWLLMLTASVARGDKEALVASIEAREAASWEMARKIWAWAEPGYQEKRSAALLADALEAAGFEVKRGVAEIPTAFTATIGSGRPVIGILGEYDALPGLSQNAEAQKQPRPGISYGHGCGHNLFGVASASACIALAEQIRARPLRGTIRFYGCPAEEGGAAKAFMVREGLFNDCDVCLHWHPGSGNVAGDRTCLARVAVKYRFYGTSAHAAGSPERGRSAVDAVELTAHAAELLREHTPDLTRIHHVITAGGAAPNVVPDFAEIFFYVRHPKAEIVSKILPRLHKCAQAGALATETKLETVYLGGTLELLPNAALARILRMNLERLNDLSYTPEERQFALRLQETFEVKPPLENIERVSEGSSIGTGSTDVGDVSWVVPTAGFATACFVPGTPGHSWQAVACSGMSIGKKGMQLAAKVLAVSAWDLMHNPEHIAAARTEFKNRLAGRTYKPLLEPDQKPPLDYRDPPKR